MALGEEQPGFYDEEIAVTIRPTDLRRSSFHVSFEMHVGERSLAEGWGTLVGYDYAAGRATPLPERVAAALRAAGAEA